MLSGSSPSRLPRISNRTAPEQSVRKVGLGCVEGSWVGGESPKSFRQRLTKILGQVRSLANFSSSGREEEGGKKNIPSLPRTAVQQTRKNELLAGKQQNFPKSALAVSAWPPPFRPHLSCSSGQRSAAGSGGSLGKRALPRERRPRAARLGPSRWEGKGRPGAAVAVSPFRQRTRGLTGARAAHGHGNSPCLQPRPPRWLLHAARRTRAAGSGRAAPGGQRGQRSSLPPHLQNQEPGAKTGPRRPCVISQATPV